MTTSEQLYLQIIQQRELLRSELVRLSVRQSAVERCRQSILAQKSVYDTDEEDESIENITSNLDAIEYDLTTFKNQLRERLQHLEQGIRILMIDSRDKHDVIFYQYVLDGALLSVRDAQVARAGYDELITSIKEISQLSD